MNSSFDEDVLIEEYTPLLVLYPEIHQGSSRLVSEDYPHGSPLEYDYHPRDIRLVLDLAGHHYRFKPWRSRTSNWQMMLDRMEKKKYRRDLDLLPGVDGDEREKFWNAYAAIPKDDEHRQRACYARAVTGSGILSDRVLVQYWYAYFYNDFWNTHEMDWETVMIVFKQDDRLRPTLCAYSAHFGGHWLPWRDVEKVDEQLKVAGDGSHPVVYVANGSHANYFYGPSMYFTTPRLVSQAASALNKKKRGLVDYTTSFEDGEPHLVKAKAIPPAAKGDWTGEWRWLNQQGRWGSPGDWDFEFGDSGPYGPPQGGDRWDSPFRWIDTHCARAPSPTDVPIPTMLEPEDPN